MTNSIEMAQVALIRDRIKALIAMYNLTPDQVRMIRCPYPHNRITMCGTCGWEPDQ